MADGNILIVDDEWVVRDLITRLLEDEGEFNVHAVENGQEALDICSQTEFDLVFTDLRMPGMSGMELLGELKHRYPELPVVMITGYGRREDVIEALRLGASNFLMKPVDIQMVSSIAERLISLRNREKLSVHIHRFMELRQQEFRIPSDLHYTLAVIDHVTVYLAPVGICEGAEVKNVRLALDEALVNAIVHGNLEIPSERKGSTLADLVAYDQLVQERSQLDPYRHRRVRVVSKLTPYTAEFTVEDEGRGFDHRRLPKEFSEIDNLTSHGRGLLLIKAFMDKVTFNEAGNAITMVKYRSGESWTDDTPPSSSSTPPLADDGSEG